MQEIIKSILDLWDPYKLYIFPKDEYIEYSDSLFKYLSEEKELNVEEITKFLHNLIPPISKSIIQSLDIVEYERVSRLLFLVFCNK